MRDGDTLLQAGRGDLDVVLGYGGILGGVTYLLLMSSTFFVPIAIIRKRPYVEEGSVTVEVALALLSVFVFGQKLSLFLYPVLWLLLGLTIYLYIWLSNRAGIGLPVYG